VFVAIVCFTAFDDDDESCLDGLDFLGCHDDFSSQI
jgi:hypothetical protein